MSEVTLSPSADSYIEQLNPTTNRGSATSLYVGEDNLSTALIRLLIKFDLSSLSGYTVTSAVLKLYEVATANYSANQRTCRAYRVLRVWTEAGVTWNKYDGSSDWGTVGCANTSTDREATDVGTCVFPATEVADAEYSFTLTASAVQAMVDGSFTNNGFLLQMDTETADQHEVRSKEYATEALRPVLVVNYTLPVSGFLSIL